MFTDIVYILILVSNWSSLPLVVAKGRRRNNKLPVLRVNQPHDLAPIPKNEPGRLPLHLPEQKSEQKYTIL